MEDNGIKQHQQMARGDGIYGDQSFGCEPGFKQVGGEATPRGTLKEGSRGITRPRGFHPEPDHGGRE